MTGERERIIERERIPLNPTVFIVIFNSQQVTMAVNALRDFFGNKSFIFIQTPLSMARLPFYLPGCKLINVIGSFDKEEKKAQIFIHYFDNDKQEKIIAIISPTLSPVTITIDFSGNMVYFSEGDGEICAAVMLVIEE